MPDSIRQRTERVHRALVLIHSSTAALVTDQQQARFENDSITAVDPIEVLEAVHHATFAGLDELYWVTEALDDKGVLDVPAPNSDEREAAQKRSADQQEHAAAAPISIQKLRTSEDEDVQQELARLARVDAIGRAMVLEGAFPRTAEGWVRVGQALDTLAGDGDPNDERDEWAYYIGMATGLRLARVDGAR